MDAMWYANWIRLLPAESESEKIRNIEAADMLERMAEENNTLNTLRDAIYEDAVAHGLWEDCHSAMDCASLIFSEVSELESSAEYVYQDGYCDYQEYAEELADVIIMCLSVAGKLGIDIDAAVRRKMEINKRRTWKHGKEKEHETRKSV